MKKIEVEDVEIEQKPEKNEVKIDYFTSLIDDCMFNIFDRLTLHDLCNISKTCVSLRDIAGQYFIRKYPNEASARVSMYVCNIGIELWPSKRFVDCFSHCFTSIEIIDETNENTSIAVYKEIAKLIETHFNENVKLLLLRGRFNGLLANAIRGILKSVEKIEFSNQLSTYRRYDNILQHCSRLKKVVFPDINAQVKFTFPQVVLPELEYIEFTPTNPSKYGIGQFLQQNRKIKTMVCRLYTTNLGNILKTVLDSAVNFQSLILRFKSPAVDLRTVIKKLKIMVERSHLNGLDLRINSQKTKFNRMEELASLKQSLIALHLVKAVPALRILASTSFENLQFLELRRLSIDKTIAIRLSENLPSLESLLYDVVADTAGEPNHLMNVEPFAEKSKNLKEIVIRGYKFGIMNMEDIACFNTSREKLNDACELVVYMVPESLEHINTTNEQNKVGDLVKLQPIELWRGVTKNPMIGSYYALL